jgi:hypothetical protein
MAPSLFLPEAIPSEPAIIVLVTTLLFLYQSILSKNYYDSRGVGK